MGGWGTRDAVGRAGPTLFLTYVTSPVHNRAIIGGRPRGGIDCQSGPFTQRHQHRIESFSSEQTDQRLARSLIHLSQRFGQALEDGSIHMMPITHELLSRYVATSRELVTQRMNEFRRLGYVRYSRKEIVLYPEALRKVFGIHVATT